MAALSVAGGLGAGMAALSVAGGLGAGMATLSLMSPLCGSHSICILISSPALASIM